SRTDTSWPAASSASARCEPMKPAPPVISARTGPQRSRRRPEAAPAGGGAGGGPGRRTIKTPMLPGVRGPAAAVLVPVEGARDLGETTAQGGDACTALLKATPCTGAG